DACRLRWQRTAAIPHARRMGPDPPPPNEPPTKADIDACRRCDLGAKATQGVDGEGASRPYLMLVGEQPGNDEDLRGRPFVGPAGKLLRQMMAEAKIPFTRVYITNAVKHFSFELRGKRRIHKTPLQRHIAACQVWLERELAGLRPRVIVALGATALRAVLGRALPVGRARGQDLALPDGTRVFATYHPSALLRAPDPESAAKLRALVLTDLRRAYEAATRGKA
ncbi:MAG TPA: UdgX family uracil-DNA binding protein, partial [Steroidobacteraceae bacterium]|nr:UdgX family uracil-DNA binding protein [Steroidobacteraceae bacterium]